MARRIGVRAVVATGGRAAAAAALIAAFALVVAPALPVLAQTTPAPAPLPAGLELLRLTPSGQPPLAFLDPDTFGDLRDQFNADTGYVRVALLLSPS
jgi:hypothetical protein